MPYLYCKECEGIYELRNGESPKDLDVCKCGGKLKYYIYLENINKPYLNSETKKEPKNFSSNANYYSNMYPQYDTNYKSNVRKNNTNPNSGKTLENIFILGFCLFIGTWLNDSWLFLIAPLITGITFKKNGYAIGSFLGALILGFSSLIARIFSYYIHITCNGITFTFRISFTCINQSFFKRSSNWSDWGSCWSFHRALNPIIQKSYWIYINI